MQTEVETEAEVVDADDTERKGRRKVRRCSSCGGLIVTRVCIACQVERARKQ